MSREFSFKERIQALGEPASLWILVRDLNVHKLHGSFHLGGSTCRPALEYALVAVHHGAHTWIWNCPSNGKRVSHALCTARINSDRQQ